MNWTLKYKTMVQNTLTTDQFFCKLNDNIFAKFGFNAQNFLSDSYCWWMTYIVDDKPIQLVTLSLISSRLEHNGDFVNF